MSKLARDGSAPATTDANQAAWITDIVNAIQPRHLHTFFPGVPANSAIMFRMIVPFAFTLPVACAGSTAKCSNPTASTVLSIKKGVTEVGTITFAQTTGVATFAAAAAASFAVGDELTIVNQADNDATANDFAISLALTLP